MSASERNKEPEIHEPATRTRARPNGFIPLHAPARTAIRTSAPDRMQPSGDYAASGPIAFLSPSLDQTAGPGDTALQSDESVSDDRFFSRVIETSAQPFCSVDTDGRLKACNLAFLEMLDYSAEDAQLKTWSDFIPPELRERDAGLLSELRHKGLPQQRETQFLRRDGSRVPVEASIHRIVDVSGDVYCCWFVRDITERKQVEGKLQKANEDLSSYIAELEQRNRETELFGDMVSLLQACATREEVQSVVARLVRELFASDSGSLYLLNPVSMLFEPVAVWGELRAGELAITARECWSLRLGKMYLVDAALPGVLCGHVRQPLETASLCIPLVAQGETLGLLHLQFNQRWKSLSAEVRDRQKRHKQQLAIAVAENIALSLANFKLRDTLYIQSIHDYLTGLYNRRYMAELLEKELHRMARKKQPAGVIIIDIDRFKGFNDTFGHEAGDMVLREFSLFLRKNIREEDFACRYGGDEFVVILPETPLDNARLRAEQLRAGVKNLNMQFRGCALDSVTLSLGVAVYPNHGLSSETLLRTADAALYRAKAEGRDRVVSL